MHNIIHLFQSHAGSADDFEIVDSGRPLLLGVCGSANSRPLVVVTKPREQIEWQSA